MILMADELDGYMLLMANAMWNQNWYTFTHWLVAFVVFEFFDILAYCWIYSFYCFFCIFFRLFCFDSTQYSNVLFWFLSPAYQSPRKRTRSYFSHVKYEISVLRSSFQPIKTLIFFGSTINIYIIQSPIPINFAISR